MTRLSERDRLPEVSRRGAIALLGVGGLSISGLVTASKPELIVGHPRAEGAPVAVERDITDESIAYRPESDTVRWSKSTGQDGPYVTEPFEKWASRRAASVGSTVVIPTIQDRISKEVTGIGTGMAGELIGTVISVRFGTTFDAEGDVISEPNLSKETLIEEAPRTVRSTIALDGRTFTRQVPVFIEEADLYED